MALGVFGFPLVVLAAIGNVPLAAVSVIYADVHFCAAILTEKQARQRVDFPVPVGASDGRVFQNPLCGFKVGAVNNRLIEQYFDDTLAAGFAGQNQMLTTLSAMLRRNVKTDTAVQAARTVNRQKVPVYQSDLTMIQNTFMAALREVKKEIGNDFTAAQSLTRDVTQQMFIELTKGQDVQTPTITPEMISAAVTQSAAGMDGVQKEALDKFGQALTEFLQSTLDHAQEKQNADPEQ